MNKILKKVLIIIGFIVIVVIVSYGLYYLFFRPITPTEVVTEPEQGTDVTGLPSVNEGLPGVIVNTNINGSLTDQENLSENLISEIANGGFTSVKEIVGSRIEAPITNTQGGINYYNASEGRFYKIDSSGNISRLSDQRFFGVEKITWAPDSDKAVLEYPDGSNIIYDFNLDKQYTIAKEFQDFDFSANSNTLAAEAIGPNDENNWLITLDATGSNLEFIERLGSNSRYVDVNWSPNNQVVALYAKNVSASNQEIILVGQNSENFKSITTYGRGFEGQWTPDGEKILYSVYREDTDFKPTLWVVDASGSQIGLNNYSLGLETWSDKCTVSQDSLTAYCGVPNSLPAGSGLYPDLVEDNYDSFYEIDLNTGNFSLLAIPEGDLEGYSAETIFLSADESIIYFQDANSQRIYSINLE